jgi:hypothetical protein
VSASPSRNPNTAQLEDPFEQLNWLLSSDQTSPWAVWFQTLASPDRGPTRAVELFVRQNPILFSPTF